MLRELLAPRWVAFHLLVLAAVAVTGFFGWWQLGSWRAGSAPPPPAPTAPAVPLTDLLAPGAPVTAEAARRRVEVTGTYAADQQLLVPERELDGRAGFGVVTPLELPSGAVVPVLRGWVPSADDPATAVPPGPVAVAGRLQPSEPGDPGTFLPEGQLPFVATPELMQRLPYAPEDLYDGYVLLTGQAPAPGAAPAGDAPEPVPAPVPLPEPPPPVADVSPLRNLSYAAQWWVFGLGAVVLWGAAVRRRAGERRAGLSTEEHDAGGTDGGAGGGAGDGAGGGAGSAPPVTAGPAPRS